MTNNGKQKSVLIVEDEVALSKALSLKLTSAGLETTVANNGADAVEILKSKKFDIVLLDLIMPQMDGFTVLKQLKDLKIKTPIIVSSNLGQPEDVEKTKALGAIDYIIKSETPISGIVAKVLSHLK